jgi:hypothetical protein
MMKDLTPKFRITTKHHGPVKREEIHAWLSVDAMNEMEAFL